MTLPKVLFSVLHAVCLLYLLFQVKPDDTVDGSFPVRPGPLVVGSAASPVAFPAYVPRGRNASDTTTSATATATTTVADGVSLAAPTAIVPGPAVAVTTVTGVPLEAETGLTTRALGQGVLA